MSKSNANSGVKSGVKPAPNPAIDKIAKMQKALKDASAAMTKATVEYEDTVKAEHKALTEQIAALTQAVGSAEFAHITLPLSDTAQEFADQYAAKVNAQEDAKEDVQEEPVMPIQTKPETDVAAIPATNAICCCLIALFALIGLIAILNVIIPPDNGGNGGKTIIEKKDKNKDKGKENAKPLAIVDAVLSDTTLTQVEKFTLACQRLYQEYFAENGTGTDEEKREQARQFALKYIPPSNVPSEQIDQLLQKVQQIEEKVQAAQPPKEPEGKLLETPPLWKHLPLEDLPPEPEIKDETQPAKPETKQKPARKGLPFFRQRADGSYEWQETAATVPFRFGTVECVSLLFHSNVTSVTDWTCCSEAHFLYQKTLNTGAKI